MPDPAEHELQQSLKLLAELERFCGGQPSILAKDLQLIRVIEDLIDALVIKGVISTGDLPEAVQLKLLERQALRHKGHFALKEQSDLIRL
jgi:hypothetical protein